MDFLIREANLPQDFTGIANVLNAVNVEWPVTAEELERRDAFRDPKFHHAVFVAEGKVTGIGQLIGTATAEHEPAAHREGKFKLAICVCPEWQKHGIGSRLYQALMRHLDPLEPQELHAVVGEEKHRAVQFIKDRGFVEEWRRIESRLDVTNFDFRPYVGLEEKIKNSGLEVKTYAELVDDAARLEKLYELDWLLYQDVPFGNVITKISLEQFEQEWVNAPDFIAEACFIVLIGDEFVGYSSLTQGEGYYWTAMTGVLPEYRGRGVATLLKLYAIRYAQEHGNLEIRAVNDLSNEAILALGTKLGFKRQGAMIRFVKRLNNETSEEVEH